VHNYLAAHLYANATAEDFWNAQTETSHKPVDKIMESFIAQPGVPGLTLSGPKDKVELTQRRFFLSPSMKAGASQVWTLPVCLKEGGDDKCDLVAASHQTYPPLEETFFFANGGGKGYYRSAYSPGLYAKLVNNVESGLNPEERISLLGDEWAQVQANSAPVGSYLDLVTAMKDDPSGTVLSLAFGSAGDATGSTLSGGALTSIDAKIASTEAERDALAAWIRRVFKPSLERLGSPLASDNAEKQELRANLFLALGTVGNDPEVIAQAKSISEKFLADPASVDSTFAQAATKVAAVHGDTDFFDRLQHVYETSGNPELAHTALNLLAYFTDPGLEKRALDYFVSGNVRNQDSPHLLARMLRERDTREIAWNYAQQNWDKVKVQFTPLSGGRFVGAAGSFCTPEARDQVTAFFATHKVASSERALTRATNQINDCIELRANQEPKLKEWLATQK
jgi:aminopeptidase N/puromycin-sensitive aminopeptidase